MECLGGVHQVLDPSSRPNGRLELADIQNMLAERLPLLPPFRWRLKPVPLGLDYPYWIDDPDFDLEYHVRELAIAAPPTDEKLADQVARIFSRSLDRTRPLWEVYVIQGLADGHVAVMTKIHHAVIDDGLPGPRTRGTGDVRPRRARRAALRDSRRPRAPRDAPEHRGRRRARADSGAKTVGRTTARIARLLRGGEQRVLERSTLEPPRTQFNGHVSAHRRLSFGQLSLAEVKVVKNAHGCTVNDVVLALCAGAG